MKSTRRTVLSAAMIAGTMGLGAASAPVYACSSDPYISSVCVMAAARLGAFGNTYILANGQSLQVSAYQALYALLGSTYGGNNTTTFNVPNLSGRMVLGSGIYSDSTTGNVSYQAGGKGGLVNTVLNVSNLPPHAHSLTTSPTGVTVNVGGNITAATTLSGLTTTTNLATIPFTSSTSNLSIKALSTGGTLSAPTASAYLSKPSTGTLSIYTTTAPDTVMAPGSVVGTVSGTLSGVAPGTVSGGTAATTITGLPTVAVSGQTNVAGAGQYFSTMPPYLVLNYYIATTGVYPVND